jgi:hypothetical protein
MLDAQSTRTAHDAQAVSRTAGAVPAGKRRAPAVANRAGSWSASEAGRWGWLPELTLLSSFGLLLIAATNLGAYMAAPWAPAAFWAGLMLVVIPVVMRLAMREVTRAERLALVVLLVMAMYLAKVIHSPLAFTFADELVHAYNLEAILGSGRLFAENAILPVSPLYPGLVTATAALASLSGLSPFVAALVVIGVARFVLALSIFLLFERLTGSPRVAGLGAAMFAGQPTFLFWSAQFSYESL